MDFAFLTAAPDAAAAGGGMGNVFTIGMLVVMGLALYFLMWRPQKKRDKEQAELRNSIEIGDEVTTIGGIVGRVVSIKEDTFVLETAGERSRLRFRRWAIQEVGKLSLDSDGSDSSLKQPEKGKADK